MIQKMMNIRKVRDALLEESDSDKELSEESLLSPSSNLKKELPTRTLQQTLVRLFPGPFTANMHSLSKNLVRGQSIQPVCPLCHLSGIGTDPAGLGVTGSIRSDLSKNTGGG